MSVITQGQRLSLPASNRRQPKARTARAGFFRLIDGGHQLCFRSFRESEEVKFREFCDGALENSERHEKNEMH